MVRRIRKTTRPQAEIDRFVRRHLEGDETADSLAKEAKISRAQFYNWVAQYKRNVLERSARAGMTAADLEKRAKADLIAEIEALRSENRKLRDRLVESMLRG